MDELTDLRATLDPAVLSLPIGGEVYIVRPCTGTVWLKLQEINRRASAAVAHGDEDADVASLDTGVSEVDMYKLALGDTYQELMDGASIAEVSRAGVTAYYWQLGAESVARAVWQGKAQTPEPETEPATRSTTRVGGASTTRRRGSTTGTSTGRAVKAAPRKAAASRKR